MYNEVACRVYTCKHYARLCKINLNKTIEKLRMENETKNVDKYPREMEMKLMRNIIG